MYQLDPLHDVGSLRVNGHVSQNVERSSVREPCLCERHNVFGRNSTSCGLDASGSGLSMVKRSCEHGDELVYIKDERCLEHVSGDQLLESPHNHNTAICIRAPTPPA
jgi:hypothetical protein